MSGRHGGESRPGERLAGPLDSEAPEAKLVGLLGFLLVVAVTPPTHPWALAAQAALAGATAVAALVEPRALVRRLALDLPLVILAVTYAVAGRGPRTAVLGLSLSSAGLRVGLGLVAKASIGIVAVSALAASTSIIEVVTGLRRLRAPGWLCDLVGLSARQVGVLGDDLERLRLAAAVRAGGRGRRAEWGGVARALGVTFVRATERVDRLQLAASARGGTTLGAMAATAGPVPSGTVRGWAGAALPAFGALLARLVL